MEATISTQNGYVATLCDRNYLHDFVRPKNGLLRPLRFKMDMLRLSRTKSVMMRIMGMLRLCGIEVVFVRPCATQMGSVAIMCGSKEICCNLLDRKNYVASIATQNEHAGTLQDQRKILQLCATQKDIFCDFVQKKLSVRL